MVKALTVTRGGAGRGGNGVVRFFLLTGMGRNKAPRHGFEPGTGVEQINRERGTGNGERGTGNGEQGTGNGERGTGTETLPSLLLLYFRVPAFLPANLMVPSSTSNSTVPF